MREIIVVIIGDISAEDLFRMFFGGQVFNGSTYATAYNSCNLAVIMHSLLPLKCVFTKRIINIWNSLPVHVVNSSSVNSFKNNLDKPVGDWFTRF